MRRVDEEMERRRSSGRCSGSSTTTPAPQQQPNDGRDRGQHGQRRHHPDGRLGRIGRSPTKKIEGDKNYKFWFLVIES